MSHQSYNQQKHQMKRIKSADKYPSQAPILALPPTMMKEFNYETNNSFPSSPDSNHKPLLLPSRLKDYLSSLQAKNSNLPQYEKKAIELGYPGFSNKNKQN